MWYIIIIDKGKYFTSRFRGVVEVMFLDVFIKHKRFFVFGLVFLLGFWFGLDLARNNKTTQKEKATVEFLYDDEGESRGDVFGGETPDETLDMFLGALERDDIDLAVRYVLAEKREEARVNFRAEKESGVLDNFIREMERAANEKKRVVDKTCDWKETACLGYDYEAVENNSKHALRADLPIAKINSIIAFKFDGKNKIWKIERF